MSERPVHVIGGIAAFGAMALLAGGSFRRGRPHALQEDQGPDTQYETREEREARWRARAGAHGAGSFARSLRPYIEARHRVNMRLFGVSDGTGRSEFFPTKAEAVARRNVLLRHGFQPPPVRVGPDHKNYRESADD